MSIIIYKKYNYVYLITEISSGLKYIGVRSCNDDPMTDLKSYRSSSKNKEFWQRQKDIQSDYKYEILSLHDTREEASNEEIRLHELYNVAINSEFINAAKQTSTKFDTSGKVTVKDKHGNTMQILKTDPRYLSGELVHIFSGTTTVKDKDGNLYQVSVDDPRYLSGELVHINCNKVPVKDKDNKKYLVDKNDPRYLSGELISIFYGKVSVKDKDGNTMHVNVDDPRYLSGELVHICYGTKHTEEHNKKIAESVMGEKNPMYGKKHRPDTLEKFKGNTSGNKKIFADGKIYNSRKEAAESLNVNVMTITKRCQSDKFPNWYYIEKGP